MEIKEIEKELEKLKRDSTEIISIVGTNGIIYTISKLQARAKKYMLIKLIPEKNHIFYMNEAGIIKYIQNVTRDIK